MRPKGLILVWAFVLSWPLQAWELPPPLETAHLLGRGLAAGAPPLPLTDELYALGWSRSNAFAVLERRTVALGQREARLTLFELVEDKVLWQAVWPDWGTDVSQEVWWAEHQSEIEAILNRFGVKPNSWQLGVFPLILDNEYYTVALRTQRSTRDNQWLDQLEILVHSTGRGLKTVKTAAGYWRWAALVGFVPSPFENRLALILLVQPSGWMGKQQPLRFLVTGVSLKAGFPAP